MNDRQWSDSGYEAIARLLGARAGLTFRPSQRSSIEQGIQRAMSREGTSDFAAYLDRLESDAIALDNLLVQTTVGETYFFRDPGQFQVISELILPDICERSDRNHTIRLWSAACASGEEAYSLAMLLHRKGLLSRSSILGTDISRDALNLASQATYREWSLRGAGKQQAAPYLTEIDGEYRVAPEIRASAHFEYLNLALDNYPSTATGTRGVDLILCRNVMIYFDRETIRSIVNRFHRCLVPGGWLITAVSDPQIHEYDLFDVIPTNHGMIFRKSEPTRQDKSVGPSLGQAGGTQSTAREETAGQGTIASEPASRSAKAPSTEEAAKLAEAKTAMDAGEYEQAAEIAAQLTQFDEAAIIHIQALANRDVRRAERACDAASKQRPLSKELHYLHAVLLMDLNRHADAATALQRVLYLDRTLALAHFSLAVVLRTLGKLDDARREFLLAQEICLACQPGDLVPLGEDQRVGDLLEMIKLQLSAIDKAVGART